MGVPRFYAGIISATFLWVGAMLTFLAYHTPPYAFNVYLAVGSTVFWLGAFLLASTLLGNTLKLATRYLRTPKGALVGGTYITAHLLLYGFVLEGILVYAYAIPPFISGSFGYLSSNLLYPASPANAVLGMAFSPSINLLLPPVFEISLSAFAIFIAVLVDLLILANITKVGEIGRAASRVVKSRAYVLMPLTGIALGASCCMSLPFLLIIVAPTLAAPGPLIWAFYITYFVFPPFALVVLKLNFDLAAKIADRASAQGTEAPTPIAV
jgi:hypothetical protein